MKTRILAIIAIVIVGFLSTTHAQLAINPTTVQFDVPLDYNLTYLDGTPIVTRYELRVYLNDNQGTTAIVTQDLGKPNPTSGISVQVSLSPLMKAACALEIKYVAKVVAIGSRGGEGVSDNSNPFGFSDPNNKTVHQVSGVVIK